MLVHKRTLGVLQWVWDGVSYMTFDGAVCPRMTAATCEGLGLDRDEWWEVPNGSPLARVIGLHYPFFDPVAVDGELVGVQVWPPWKRYGEEEPPPDAPRARRRGKYNRRS